MQSRGSLHNATITSSKDSRTAASNRNGVRTRTISNGHSTARRSTASSNLLNADQSTSTIIDIGVCSWEAGFIRNRNKTTNIINKVNDASVNSRSSSNKAIATAPGIAARN